jgi:hypothetical protein
MIFSPSKAFATSLLLVFCAFAAQQASAAPKKQRLDSLPAPSIMVDETPIIMQGLKRPQRAIQGRRDTGKEVERKKEEGRQKEAERHVKFPRGSAGYVPPAPLPRTPLLGQAPAASAYNPPPVSNPSERISQFNQSFQFNKGLGNNPTDRDAYVRYNFNR